MDRDYWKLGDIIFDTYLGRVCIISIEDEDIKKKVTIWEVDLHFTIISEKLSGDALCDWRTFYKKREIYDKEDFV